MAETKKPTPEKFAERWLNRIAKAQEDCSEWYEQAERAYKRYRNDAPNVRDKAKAPKRFNILWSNVEVQKPALFHDLPKVVVERRNRDQNDIGLVASQLLERATSYEITESNFGDVVKSARDDFLLSARGTMWFCYEPTYGEPKRERIPLKLEQFKGYFDDSGKRHDKGKVLEDDLGPYAEGEEFTPVKSERVRKEFVFYRDFIHGPATSWDQVPWVGRRVHMRDRKIAKRFGKAIAAEINRGKEDAERKGGNTAEKGAAPRDTTPIWEIWDKERGSVYWFCDFYDKGPLDEQEDPLGLTDFYPCPRPLFGTLTPDTLTPVPDYEQYQDQALELDRLTDRGLRISKGIRVAGVYDGAVKELQKLFNETSEDNYVAVPTWAAFADKGGLKSAMDSLPLDERVQALKSIYETRQVAKQDLYEITGISDLMRGDTDSSETATAQRMKGQFGSMRLKERQSEMQRFVRDGIRIVAEIVCEHFRPEEIIRMAGGESLGQPPEVLMQAVALLKDQGARDFDIDIETDSTIAVDEQAEKQAATEFVTAVMGFFEGVMPVMQMAPSLLPLLGELLMFAVRRYRVGRDVEQAFEKAMQGVMQEQQQRAANPPPNPEMEKLKLEAQKTQAELQAKSQFEAQKLEIERQKGEMDLQFKAAELHMKGRELEMKNEQHAHQMAMQHEQGAQQMQFEREKHGNEMAMRQHEGAQQAGLKREEMASKREIEMAKAPLGENSEGTLAAGEDAGAQALAQAAQAMNEAAQAQAKTAEAVMQMAEHLGRPVEIQRDKKTGVKRAVRVAA